MFGKIFPMSQTKDEILSLADGLIRMKGYNAFSYHDISSELKIKNAAVHYHFRSKEILGVSVIQKSSASFNTFYEELEKSDFNEIQQLEAFLDIFSRFKEEEKICLAGSLATDFNTLPSSMKEELNGMTQTLLNWLIQLLEKGKKNNIFFFDIPSRTKALLIITNMIAALQIIRLVGKEEFDEIRKAIIKEITDKK